MKIQRIPTKKQIDTIAMTRKIRDEHAERLAGKSHAERITFFRERTNKLEHLLRQVREKQTVYNKK